MHVSEKLRYLLWKIFSRHSYLSFPRNGCLGGGEEKGWKGQWNFAFSRAYKCRARARIGTYICIYSEKASKASRIWILQKNLVCVCVRGGDGGARSGNVCTEQGISEMRATALKPSLSAPTLLSHGFYSSSNRSLCFFHCCVSFWIQAELSASVCTLSRELFNARVRWKWIEGLLRAFDRSIHAWFFNVKFSYFCCYSMFFHTMN